MDRSARAAAITRGQEIELCSIEADQSFTVTAGFSKLQSGSASATTGWTLPCCWCGGEPSVRSDRRESEM